MGIEKSTFWNNDIKDHFSVFFNSDIELGYWNCTENKYKQGLVISTSNDSEALKALKAYVPASFIDGQDLCIGFDDSIAFLKKFKKAYLSRCKDQEEFTECYFNFFEKYIKKIQNISLSSKLKP